MRLPLNAKLTIGSMTYRGGDEIPEGISFTPIEDEKAPAKKPVENKKPAEPKPLKTEVKDGYKPKHK